MKNITIRKGESGGYHVRSGIVWLPGVYDSEETARKSQDFRLEHVVDVWNRVLLEGKQIITYDDLCCIDVVKD